MNVSISDFIDNDRQSHYWYGGECARIKHNGYTAIIEANGDIYAEYAPNGEYVTCVKDKSNSGSFYNEMNYYLKNDKDLYKANENGDLIIDDNNWWECFIVDRQGNFYDLMWALDADTITEAIEEVKAGFDEMIKYIEEEQI